MKRIYLIDCPGIVPPSMGDSPEDLLMRGVVRVENVENPAQYVPAVLEKCKRHHLERTYGVNGWTGFSSSAGATDGENIVGKPSSDKQKTEEAIRFLEALARKGGRLLKGGEADLDGVAKMVLNDFLRGKIPWFVPPPQTEEQVGKGDGKGQEEGRDGLLGFTHGKRKRELREEETDGRGDVEADENADSESENEEGFDGFDEEEEAESSVSSPDAEDKLSGGVELVDGDSENDALG